MNDEVIADFAGAPARSRLRMRRLDNLPPSAQPRRWPLRRTPLAVRKLDGVPVEYCVGRYPVPEIVATYTRANGAEIDPLALTMAYVRWAAQRRDYQGEPALERCDERIVGGFWISLINAPEA